ncbi:hypothetical protein D3C87_269430 [compost metagenome]
MKELDEIDRLFQTTFEGFESTPDPSVKINIDRAIATKKKRRRFLFIWFPVLFGTMALAGILYFRPDSKHSFIAKKTQTNQQIQPRMEQSQTTPTVRGIQKNQAITNQTLLTKNSTSKYAEKSAVKPVFTPIQIPYIAANRDQKIPKAQTVQIGHSDRSQLIPTVDQTNPAEAEVSATENNSDSLTASAQADSAITTDLTTSINNPDLLPEVKKTHINWSVSLITGWENEARTQAKQFNSTLFPGTSKEFARIQSTSFYGKIELNRRINARFHAVIGLGFRSSRIRQYGSRYSSDSASVVEGTTSSPIIPDSVVYVSKNQTGIRTFQLNSVTLPLGLSYSVLIGPRFGIRLSGGTEFIYSWMREKESPLQLTPPEFRPFGLNAWLRPEIHYSFGKFQLFGFGTINQPLVQQLKWNFEVNRNPAFGAGIGMLIHL